MTEATDDPKQCEFCAYFNDTKDGFGECRRYAPRPTNAGLLEAALTYLSDRARIDYQRGPLFDPDFIMPCSQFDPDFIMMPRFASTAGDDWCGEYRRIDKAENK